MTRPIAGRLRFPTPPEPGTLLGRMWTDEWIVALDTVDGVTQVGYATADERNIRPSSPRSVFEARAVAMLGRADFLRALATTTESGSTAPRTPGPGRRGSAGRRQR